MLPTGLEAATRGAAVATSHRVVSPPVGSGPRYSVPLFQNISQHVRVSQEILDCTSRFSAIFFWSQCGGFLT